MATHRDFDSLQRRIAQIPDDLKKKVIVALDKSTAEVVRSMEHLVETDDGDLKRSIKVEPGETEFRRYVKAGGSLTTRQNKRGDNYDYSLANEFGTEDMNAQPFFFPAWRLNRKKAAARLKRAARMAVRGMKGDA